MMRRQPIPTTNQPIYAALDLGTNNCRLLIARHEGDKDGYTPQLKIVDSFSRIVRLGQGVGSTGRLSDEAIERTLIALKQCKNKLDRYPLTLGQYVATEACRRADNTDRFLARVHQETGLRIDIISTEEEARLAFLGCSSLLDRSARNALVFDIGGGSTECMWINLDPTLPQGLNEFGRIADWASIPFGVMNLSEKAGGYAYTEAYFDETVEQLSELLRPFDRANHISETISSQPVQMLSTSGTVTTLAAIHMGLARYDRSRVDGVQLRMDDIRYTTRRLLDMRPSERFHHPCIGPDRADYIISGCAIFEAIATLWPLESITVADRGVREGIIMSLIRKQKESEHV